MVEIVHVTKRETWEAARAAGEYRAASLASEGFIHCSTHEQLSGVVQRYYAGQTGLVVLRIDTGRLKPPLRWERSPSVNEDFPHLYGPLNADAVLGAVPLETMLAG